MVLQTYNVQDNEISDLKYEIPEKPKKTQIEIFISFENSLNIILQKILKYIWGIKSINSYPVD